MKLRYQYRIYPTNSQKKLLAQLFGCVRVVFNDALSHCQQKYRNKEKKPTGNELSSRLTNLKKTEERKWLNEVSSIPLQQSVRDLETAFKNFFDSCIGKRKGKKVKPPRFKKRKSRQSARFTDNGFKVYQQKVYLAKIGKLKIVWSRPLPVKPSSCTIIKDSADRYFLSFVVEINPQKLPDNGNAIGIDLGITDFATLSTGEKIKAPKPLKKQLRKLRKAQKNLSRAIKGSNRREKRRKTVARIYAKISDTRTDFLHKLSSRLIRENQTIILEDLNTCGLMKNRKLSRAISDLGWRTFRDMLEAKSLMYGREFRVISRWEPTSQRCSCCGKIGGKKELDVREWTCLLCGTMHDRDINASVNIKNAGLKPKVAGGHSETQNQTVRECKTTFKVATPDETFTTPRYIQLSLLDLL